MKFSFSFSFTCMLMYLCFVAQLSESATVIVDGVSQWTNPNLQIGDSVIFQHKDHYNLYIFKTQEAFTLCNFSQTTLLTKPNSSSYTWHTSRPGLFFFAFNNGSNALCIGGQKFAVKVTAVAPQTSPPPASGPGPVSGGGVASSPAFPWPFKPRDSASPSPAPGLSFTVAAGPAAAPGKEGIPFINSNPAVPLPTGEVDSATIRPLPTSSAQVVGFGGVLRALSCVILLLVMMV